MELRRPDVRIVTQISNPSPMASSSNQIVSSSGISGISDITRRRAVVIIEILDTWNINLLWLTILKKLNITTNCINSILCHGTSLKKYHVEPETGILYKPPFRLLEFPQLGIIPLGIVLSDIC